MMPLQRSALLILAAFLLAALGPWSASAQVRSDRSPSSPSEHAPSTSDRSPSDQSASVAAPLEPAATATSLSGVHGLVTIPTAELSPDGTLTMGFNKLNRGSLEYHEGRHHASSPYVSLSYLPFVEVGFRLTRAESPIEEAFGDRTVSARVLVARESGRRPALLVGVHDFVGQKRHFQATYAVASKRFDGPWAFDHVSLHVGYGVKLLNADLYDFVGLFGGVALAPVPHVRVMGEYDSRHVNVGLSARVFRRAHVIVGLTNFRAVSGGVSYSFILPQ